MKVVYKIKELRESLDEAKKNGSIGFVPTMGALHNGHISLVKRSVLENHTTVVSIFVNPTQFNNIVDLEKYPRNLFKDVYLLEETNCDIVFAPSVEEMYPEPDKREFDFGNLENVMEGKHRPGHFNGVGQIVSKFFDFVQPNKSYFGLKDFQQLAIIKKLVKDYNYTIEIIPCPIVRENDGLAMSSRNMLIEPQMRKESSMIYHILNLAKENYYELRLHEMYRLVKNEFDRLQYLKLEYFEIVDDETLTEVPDLPYDKPCTACVAVFAGMVRLIDNIQINS